MRRYQVGRWISRTGLWQRQQRPSSTWIVASVVWQVSHQSTVPVAAIDQPGLEQREEQPLRPAVHGPRRSS